MCFIGITTKNAIKYSIYHEIVFKIRLKIIRYTKDSNIFLELKKIPKYEVNKCTVLIFFEIDVMNFCNINDMI